MPLLEPTGPPRIVLDSGAIIDLPYPDSANFMKGEYIDQSDFSLSTGKDRRLVDERLLRPQFTFGYQALNTTSAADLISTFENDLTFLFLPRTLAAGDPVTAVERAYRCRIISDMPFSVDAKTGFVAMDLVFESVNQELGTGVAGVAGTVYFTTNSQNVGAGSFAAGSVIEANHLYQRNPDGVLIDLVDFGGLIPTAFAISQSSGLLIVGFQTGEIQTFSLDGTFVAQLVDIGAEVVGLITFNSGAFTNQVFYVDPVSGSDRDVFRIPITGGTPTFVFNQTSFRPHLAPWVSRSRFLTIHNATGIGVQSHLGNGTNNEVHYSPSNTTGDGVLHDPARSLIFFKNASAWRSVPDVGTTTSAASYGTNTLTHHWLDIARDRVYGRDTNLQYMQSPVLVDLIEESFLISGVQVTSADFGNYGVRDARVWQP